MTEKAVPVFKSSDLFGKDGPVEVDIGCGKGKFLLKRAEENPEINFLGIDKAGKWMKIGQRRGEKRNFSNLKFLKGEARDILDGLGPETVSVFHIYFPDPWPKRRHRKRRLVTALLLIFLFERLVPGGFIEIATDDSDYFAGIKRAVSDSGIDWDSVRESVNQRLVHEAIKTNYEMKYEAADKPLYYLELRK